MRKYTGRPEDYLWSSRALMDALIGFGGNGACDWKAYWEIVDAARAAGIGLPRDLAGHQPALPTRPEAVFAARRDELPGDVDQYVEVE